MDFYFQIYKYFTPTLQIKAEQWEHLLVKQNKHKRHQIIGPGYNLVTLGFFLTREIIWISFFLPFYPDITIFSSPEHNVLKGSF